MLFGLLCWNLQLITHGSSRDPGKASGAAPCWIWPHLGSCHLVLVPIHSQLKRSPPCHTPTWFPPLSSLLARPIVPSGSVQCHLGDKNSSGKLHAWAAQPSLDANFMWCSCPKCWLQESQNRKQADKNSLPLKEQSFEREKLAHFALPIFFLLLLLKIPSASERENFSSFSWSVSIVCKTLRSPTKSVPCNES